MKQLRTACRIAFVSILLTLSSCSERNAGVDFVFINGSEPQSLDPAIVTGQIEGRLCNALFEGLTARNAHGIAQPAVAERWEMSSDGLSYTFTLRVDAMWSNGDPVTAYDFEQSWRRVLEPATASKYAEILYFIRNAEAFNKGKLKDFSQVGIEARSERILVVTLENPTPFFIDLTSFTTYLPVHSPTLRLHGDAWTKPGKMVSNGAYMLEDWRIHDRVRLVKNPHYWRRDTVAFHRLDALAVESASTAFNLYATGQADLVLDKSMIPPMLISELRQRPYFHSNPFLATYFYRFNVTEKPFDDVRVRKAFALAIDKQTIVEKITRAGEPVAHAFTPTGIPGYEPPSGLRPDADLARNLLAEAGYPGGKDFPRVNLLYNKTELNEQIAVEIQSMWERELGVRVELRNQEWATYLNSLDHLDFNIARSSWIGDYNDPNTFLDCFLTARGNNRTGWSHARYDELMRQSARELDPQKRFATMREAETILVEEELPIVPLYYFVGIVLYDATRLAGMEPNVVDEHPIREMYWKKGRP